MTDTPLKVAFAGANAERAWAKDAHLPAVTALPGLALHAVSARSQDLADKAAHAFGAPKAYGDSLEMVQDPEIDIVSVTVKVPEHRAIVLAALAAGKHIYCEWPLGRDLAEAEEMAAAARDADVHAAIGLQGANSKAVQHAASLVRDGAIGRPLSLRVVSPTAGWGREAPAFYAYLQDKTNGATLSTIAGGHTLAAIENVVGAYVDVSAINTIRFPEMKLTGQDETVARTSPDHILVIGHHASGCVSSLEVLGGEARPTFLFELRGETGMLTIEGHFAGGFQGGVLAVTSDVGAPAVPAASAPGLTGPAANVSELYASLERDIRTGSRSAPDFDRAVRLTRLLDAIDEASETGRRILVQEGA
ncbi:Gfo/Idh/MocA family oxidoreductase [Sphingomonas sp. BIUV-7]|uniref:Gfo/Idh/MocA family oxidoreductase n=1 Tax=Sphingomonas natans TaxID=3063330 RepID=A0ABT8Y872_9SPHN|nr:Gfo/Idh/MocA family oxidoreductase [Sphingomonas sp. BIUV-7]MDO6414515.1 Gfo/Idh/MocA family oxidoreductase [Sphingomonas sp. BIUV-7]